MSASTTFGCGEPNRDPDLGIVSKPIIGGQIDEIDKGAVGIAFNASWYGFARGGSGVLIAPNLILTARHLVAVSGGTGGVVVCPETEFTYQHSGDIYRATTDTVAPNEDGPGYFKGKGPMAHPESNVECGNDVALFILEGAGVPPEVATPIVPRIDSPAEPGEIYAAIGYGMTDTGDPNSDGTRMRLDGNVIDCAGFECGSDKVQQGEWMSELSKTWQGDSGGPAIDSQGRVIGIVSRGGAAGGMTVYSDVSIWKDLIVKTAKRAAQLGNYPPPFWAETGSSVPPQSEPDPDPDPLGRLCTGDCPDGYDCVGSDGQGTCQPVCDPQAPTCPTGLECAADLGACVVPPPAVSNSAGSNDDGGCSTARPVDRSRWWLGVAFTALAVALAARKRKTSFES